jgi:predicted metal-binding membrane protein
VSSTPQPEAPPLAGLLSKPALISGAAVGSAALLAWVWLLSEPMAMAASAGSSHGAAPGTMAGMAAPADPWSESYLLASFMMWTLMMVAMMLPSAAPMILLHARIDRSPVLQRTRNNLLFMLSYLAVWTVFSAVAALAQAALIDGAVLSSMSLRLGNDLFAAGLLLAASAWQLTGAKRVCLEQCQSPLHFVLRHRGNGAAGAARLGLRHGLYCLGCCWSLMLLLFVAGVMNLAWVAALAFIVFVEKLVPRRWRADRWLAGLLAFGALSLLVS